MKFTHLFLVAALALSLAAGGCGKEDPATTGSAGGGGAPAKVEVSNDLASLVPSSAVAMLYVKNPGEFESKIKGLIGRVDPEMAGEIDLGTMVKRMLAGSSQYLDWAKPFAISVSLPPEGEDIEKAVKSGQAITFIVGVTDADAALTGMQAEFAKAPEGRRPSVKASASYVAITPSKTPGWGGSAPAIARTAPKGDIALRIDLASLVTRFRPMIDEALGGMGDLMGSRMGNAPPGPAQQFQKMFSGISEMAADLVDSAELFELGATIEGATVDLRVGFTAKAGSKLDVDHDYHADLAAIGAHLPDGFPLHLLLRMDTSKLLEWFGPFMDAAFDAMPEEMRGKFKAYMDEALDMSKLLGPNFAIAGGVTDKGIQLVEIVDIKDATAYMQQAEKLVARASGIFPGLAITKSEGTKVAGVDVITYEMTMDMKKMMAAQGTGGDIPPEVTEKFDAVMARLFGGSGIRFHMASVENKLIATMGDTGHMAAAIESIRGGKGKAPAALAGAIEKAGGEPAFLLHVDVRALAKQIVAVARDVADDTPIPAVPEGGPIPVVVWGAHEGRQYGGGLSVDVGGLIDFVKAFMDK